MISFYGFYPYCTVRMSFMFYMILHVMMCDVQAATQLDPYVSILQAICISCLSLSHLDKSKFRYVTYLNISC